MSKIFISGPMSNLPDYNWKAFDEAERQLSSVGHTVLNPANNTPAFEPEAITHEQYLHICKAMIDCVDAVYFLKGWQNSDGARQEMVYAIENGKELMFEGGE